MSALGFHQFNELIGLYRLRWCFFRGWAVIFGGVPDRGVVRERYWQQLLEGKAWLARRHDVDSSVLMLKGRGAEVEGVGGGQPVRHRQAGRATGRSTEHSLRP